MGIQGVANLQTVHRSRRAVHHGRRQCVAADRFRHDFGRFDPGRKTVAGARLSDSTPFSPTAKARSHTATTRSWPFISIRRRCCRSRADAGGFGGGGAAAGATAPKRTRHRDRSRHRAGTPAGRHGPRADADPAIRCTDPAARASGRVSFCGSLRKKSCLSAECSPVRSELAGKAAVVDVPVGKGHVVMFANNPMWRHETHGSFSMLFNAMLNYDNLGVGRTEARPVRNGDTRRRRRTIMADRRPKTSAEAARP